MKGKLYITMTCPYRNWPEEQKMAVPLNTHALEHGYTQAYLDSLEAHGHHPVFLCPRDPEGKLHIPSVVDLRGSHV